MKLGFQPKPVIRSALSRLASLRFGLLKNWPNAKGFVKTRTFALCFYLCLSMLIIAFAACNTKIVQVINGSGSQVVYTFRTNPVSILKQCGITLSPDDQYNFSKFKNNYARINLYQAFPVQVKADKATKKVLIAKGTVSDTLKKAGVVIGTDDLVSKPLDAAVTPGMSIQVQRVRYATSVTTQAESKPVATTSSILLRKGVKKVLTPGQDGQVTVVAKQKYVDGVLTDTQVISQNETVKPIPSEVLVGTAASTPVSQLQPSRGLTLTDNGTPSSYSRVIHGIATGYSPKDGSTCATGRHTQVGYVAVNPKVIPYGSKLYIMSPDGSFVYGYAVAEDTGGFVSNGSGVTVDLFFSSASQTSFGRKRVDIYVLS